MTLTQSTFTPSEARTICYVDDPFSAFRGSRRQRRRAAAKMILLWEALGFKLVYTKGQLGHTVNWIGGTIRIETGGITATIKGSINEDILIELDSSQPPA